MLTAAVYGLLASSGLVLGPIIGLLFSPPRRLIASIIAFGSGVLVSALTFELMEEAFERGGVAHVVAGFLAGALIYVAMDYILDRLTRRSPNRAREPGRRSGGRRPVPVAGDDGATGAARPLPRARDDGHVHRGHARVDRPRRHLRHRLGLPRVALRPGGAVTPEPRVTEVTATCHELAYDSVRGAMSP